jgi:predicted ATPase
VWVLQNSDAPLVGRERELGLLVDSFDEAQADSRCRLATVLGAAGMGKSRPSTSS